MPMMQRLHTGYTQSAGWLATWIGSFTLLFMRIWVALAFWHAGVVKFDDPTSTLFLFNAMYHVPLLPPHVAAMLGTWIELIVPWFIALGLFGRPFALFLFVYNIIAVASYPALWPHGFWTGLFGTSAFADHKVWGLMLLAVIAWGPGRFSLDALIGSLWRRWRAAHTRTAPV